jgi:putative hemolysin
MDEEGFVLELALVAVLILINGFFAAAEIAVVSARRSRLQAMVEEGNRKAEAVLRLKADPDRFLATVQIGITLVGTLASAVGGVAAVERLEPFVASMPTPWARAAAEPVAVGIVVFTIAYLSLVVGELVPKGLAVRNAEAWAVGLAPSIVALSRVTRPVVAVLTASSRLFLRILGRKDPVFRPFHTLEDLRVIAEEAQEQGVVHGGLVTGAVEFHERQVREVLTPRPRIVALSSRAGLQQALSVVRESGHSRFPVYGDQQDDVIGFVYASEIYETALRKADLDLSKLARGTLVVPAIKPATELLAEMRRSGIPMAVAIDEHGGLAGLVTIEDLVEVIVGEIPDEHAAAQELVTVLADGAVESEGSVPVHVLNDDYGLKLPESPQYVSVAGLVLERLGKLPHPGASVNVEPYILTVLAMDGCRICRVRIKHGGPDASNGSEPDEDDDAAERAPTDRSGTTSAGTRSSPAGAPGRRST